ncbi:MAG: hypothetical protein ACK4K9_04580 [Bacteroidia bacterium]
MNKFDDFKKLFFAYVDFIKSKIILISIFFLIGSVGGVVMYYLTKPKFQAGLSFLINDQKSIGSNPLTALAGQLGITTSGPALTDERILFLLGSKKIIGDALLSKYDEENTLADKLIEIYKLNKKWHKDTVLVNFEKFENYNIEKLTKKEHKALDAVMKFLVKNKFFFFESVKKKAASFVGTQASGIITLTFTCKDEMISKIFIDSVYYSLYNFYTNAITKNLNDNYELLCLRSDSILNVLKTTEYNAAEAIDDGIRVVKFKAKVEEARLRRDVEMLNIIYAEVQKNKEIAKFNLDQEKPIFEIIDKPYLPLEVRKKPIYYFAALGVFLSMGILFFYLTLMFVIKNKLI